MESASPCRVLPHVTRDEAASLLKVIHHDVDVRAQELAREHAARMVCARGCFGCCVDDLTVFEVEAARIRARYPDLLSTAEPHIAGRCAFLGEAGECRVYEARPYVCRTQGLPLRWIDDEAMAEFRDICALNDESEPIESIGGDACWTIGPIEERLARLQASLDGGTLRRVALRDLFTRK